MVARGGRPRRHARRARQGARKGCARAPARRLARGRARLLHHAPPRPARSPPAAAAELSTPRYKLLAFVVLGENRLQASPRRAARGDAGACRPGGSHRPTASCPRPAARAGCPCDVALPVGHGHGQLRFGFVQECECEGLARGAARRGARERFPLRARATPLARDTPAQDTIFCTVMVFGVYVS